MKSCARLFVLLLGIFSLASAGEKTFFLQERMVGDLEFIRNTFQANYASIEWKKKHSNWDLEREIQDAKSRVLAADSLTTKEFQNLVKRLCFSAQDYHVTAEFYSTESATLPFMVQGANSRYFFSYIDKSLIDKSLMDEKVKFPFEVGDELVSIGGIPTHQAIQKIIEEDIGHNQPATDQAMAEIHLTTRVGSLGQAVPHGTVKIAGRKKKGTKLIEHTLEWDYTPEKIANCVPNLSRSVKLPKVKSSGSKPRLTKNTFFKKQFILPQYRALKQARAEDTDPTDMLGSKKSYLPALGHILWEAPESHRFHAYVFEMPNGKQGGYVRIPTYTPERLDQLENVVADFAEIIALFQDETDVLVIDQINNPGGYVLYMYTLASMLTDKPMAVPQHRQMITQEDVFFAISELGNFEKVSSDKDAKDLLGESFEGMPVTHELVRAVAAYLRFIIDEWTAGRMFTQPVYVYGLGPLAPHQEVRYTKPILVLVNALDFSGADFFPAILQDNARATIMGTRTAGAGGYVAEVEFPNLNGIVNISYSASIAHRPDNRLIENEGVTPDIVYELSEKDLQKNYVEYVRKINQTAGSLLK